ncbi:PREDICTED: uncharacterized protein LOC108793732 [Nanorana parkeri]|uniref:uncharacterized protein LOC108793732 n=1 Tax=Nanorana parkeri TaxID=125878 RepID=UPI00085424B0|nr:PREDICTED: uncharacterized protein LOC108793732 [Nanorana parkeri]
MSELSDVMNGVIRLLPLLLFQGGKFNYLACIHSTAVLPTEPPVRELVPIYHQLSQDLHFSFRASGWQQRTSELLIARIDVHTIVEQPPFIIAEKESSVTIECKVSSLSSSFSVFWTLGCEERRLVGKESRVTYESLNRVITISNLTEFDSGIYCCLAETVEGKLVRGNGTRLEVTKTSCSADPCHCEKGALLLTMEILRVIALIILIILLIIAIRSSYKISML